MTKNCVISNCTNIFITNGSVHSFKTQTTDWTIPFLLWACIRHSLEGLILINFCGLALQTPCLLASESGSESYFLVHSYSPSTSLCLHPCPGCSHGWVGCPTRPLSSATLCKDSLLAVGWTGRGRGRSYRNSCCSWARPSIGSDYSINIVAVLLQYSPLTILLCPEPIQRSGYDSRGQVCGLYITFCTCILSSTVFIHEESVNHNYITSDYIIE